MKTFMDSEFYQRPFCNQTELKEHWNVDHKIINELVSNGTLTKKTELGNRCYSVKEIMELEGLNEDVTKMDYRRTRKRNQELEKENEELRDKLASIRNFVNVLKEER